jgi:hypothetical protein
MPGQPIQVARNQWGAILHHPDTRTLELKWFAASRQMTDDDFKATLELYTREGERLQPIARGLIDAMEFSHTFADNEALAWREEHIIPRYNAMGMTKFAFHVPPGTPGTVEAGGTPAVEARAKFPTAWFSTRERADAWLAESQ